MRVIPCGFWLGLFVSKFVLAADITAVAFDAHHFYVSRQSTTQVQHCALSPEGQLTGCIATGPTAFMDPASLALTPSAHSLYVVDAVYRNVSRCILHPESGQLVACAEVAALPNNPQAIAIGPKYAYILQGSDIRAVSVCALDSNDMLHDCRTQALQLHNPEALTVNATGTKAYLLSASGKTIWSCGIDESTGLLHACNALVLKPSDRVHNIYKSQANWNAERFISACSITAAGDLIYANQYPNGAAFRCLIEQNTADFKACFAGSNPVAYDSGLNILINTKNTKAYIVSNGMARMHCAIDADGLITQCQSTVSTVPWHDIVP